MTSGAAILAAALAVALQAQAPAQAPDLWVEAWLSTAGPYGESWTARSTPGGKVFVKALYMGTPSGSLLADFDVPAGHEERLRAAIESQKFFELPADMTPTPTHLHRPTFLLDVALGGKRHAVRLYDPEKQQGDPRVKRFLAVWAALFEGVPLKPSW